MALHETPDVRDKRLLERVDLGFVYMQSGSNSYYSIQIFVCFSTTCGQPGWPVSTEPIDTVILLFLR